MKTIIAGKKEIELYNFTGIVADTGKNMETKVSGGGGGGAVIKGYGGSAPVSIRSKTIIHDQVFLISESGEERSFQLQGFNIACRKDNKLAVIWAMSKGSKSGPYIIVHNYSTKQSFFNDKAIDGLFTPAAIFRIILVIALSVLIAQVAGWWILVLTLAAIIYFMLQNRNQINEFRKKIDLQDFQ